MVKKAKRSRTAEYIEANRAKQRARDEAKRLERLQVAKQRIISI